jgi:hypothetical protein
MANPNTVPVVLSIPTHDPNNHSIDLLWNSIRSDVNYLSSQDAFFEEDAPRVIGLVQSIDAFFSSLPESASPGLPALYRELLLTQWPQLIEYARRHNFAGALAPYATFFADHVKKLRLFPNVNLSDLPNIEGLSFQLTAAANAFNANPAAAIADHLGLLDFSIGLVSRAMTDHSEKGFQNPPIEVNFELAAFRLRKLKALTETMRRFVEMQRAMQSFVGPFSKFLAYSLKRLLVEGEIQNRQSKPK